MFDKPDFMIFLGVVALVVVVVLVIRGIRSARTTKRDPFITIDAGHVVAVDLSLFSVGRFQPDDSDPLSARLVAQRTSDPADTVVLGPWNRAALMSKAVKKQVFTSALVINEITPNVALADREERRAAVAQMQKKNAFYRFVLPHPVPLTIRTSAAGRVELDERGV